MKSVLAFLLLVTFCQADCVKNVQIGPRPYFLVDDLEDGTLKEELLSCREGPFYKSDFVIGHRGAPLQFPEHTKESYVAAARMGAGILECDVTFTMDRELVCRHAQCDLHTTTNILLTPLAAKCSEPFKPASAGSPASAKCCASDITLEEFKTLCGKMDAANRAATTVEEYVLTGTADYRTDLYSTCGTVISHKESIELFRKLGVKYTPELKSPEVEMPYQGDYTQEMYAQQMIDEYVDAKVPASSVWPQSFNLDDVVYWVKNTGRYGKQAVFLDNRYDLDTSKPRTFEPSMKDIASLGINILAPPQQMLVTLKGKKIVPSKYARAAKKAGLDIITWTFERSGPLANGGGFYFDSISDIIDNDGDAYKLLHVLAQDVGILGIFTDWPGTVTYYASCYGL